MSTPIICRPDEYAIRRILRCPTCKARRRMIAHTYVWYDPTVTCCHCGDTWIGGRRAPRPARRGWRKGTAAKASAAWIAAGRYDAAAHRAWFEEQFGHERGAA